MPPGRGARCAEAMEFEAFGYVITVLPGEWLGPAMALALVAGRLVLVAGRLARERVQCQGNRGAPVLRPWQSRPTGGGS